MSRFLITSVVALLSTSAFAARVDIADVSASSAFAASEGVRYDATQLKDGKLSTSWVEGDAGSGLGSWMQLNLGGQRAVDSIKIWAGMWYSYDYWSRANRPKSIEVKFADGTVETHELTDKMEVQELKFKKVHQTSTIHIKVKAVFKGTTWFDTAISEVQVFDKSAEKNAAVSAYRSSSVLPEDGDGNYMAQNVNDGINDSMWCEGNKEGDGTGEWLAFDFKGQEKVGSFTLVNGIGSSMMVWMKGNRAMEAQLDFADGSKEKVMVKNSFRKQTITFPARTTSSVKVTFTKVMKGKEYNDLCLSEAYFSQ
jgi:hypothetical protein